MFEFIFSSQQPNNLGSVIRQQYVSNAMIVPLLWTEHCVECAAPACYHTCKRYQKRTDGNCIRVQNGITPMIIEGQVGAKITFRTWAKIESQLKIRALAGRQYASSYRLITGLGRFFRSLAALCPITHCQQFIDAGWFSYRQRYINYLLRNQPSMYALTLYGKVDNADRATKLLVDIKTDSELLYREAVEVPLGKTTFILHIPPYESTDALCFINIHPADAEEHVTLTFDELELRPTDITEGKKIKCIIWDLDNTLWDGVLIEDKEVKLNHDFVALIKHLDSCGIVNSIVSKNNEAEVMEKLKAFGIADYFVFKKINWNPKSVNIGKTIKQMNINADTMVFVDDNPFERNEVLLRFPTLTCVDPSEILAFSKCERFNMLVSEDSKKRRKTYQMLEAMTQEEENWTGDINDFLKSCLIKVQLSAPTEAQIPRCYELLQRTNQLNASGRRLSIEEVQAIVRSKDYDAYVLNSQDKFGDYGLVGFLVVDKRPQTPMVTDFVISCRVANKKIEPTVINHLAQKYGGLLFAYKKTNKNGPMYKVIEELGMQRTETVDNGELYTHKFDPKYPVIVTLTEV